MVIPEHSMLHVQFDPVILKNPEALVTEFMMLYFPPHLSLQAEQESVHTNVQKFAALLQESSDSFYGASGGWVDVLLHPPNSAASARVYLALFGWASVEAHMKVAETQIFKDNISLLAGLKGLRHMESFHFTAPELGA